MSRHATDGMEPGPESVPSPPLPSDHVLDSGAVMFPGAFDQHGCPLIFFPVEGQDKLSSELSKAEVVDFINYVHCLHNKKQEKNSLMSVVADLRQASLPTTRFLCETLLLLELHKRTVHSVYIIQPKKKDVAKLLLKLLAPSKSAAISFKRVLLKEIPELSNYIDRSQLPSSLGGYLMYRHQSWVAFIKDIDSFVQEFLLVVQRLPSCISTLQALSRLPLPSSCTDLQQFYSTNEAKFQQLRRELGLDELLRHCECVVEKLRYPESEPCYQDMAGTTLFTHTAYDMLQNHSRITAAVEKVDLLWQQAFSKARLQLQVFHLRDDALQITERIETLLQEKLQPYTIEIAKDLPTAVSLASQFESSIHTPAMALVRCAEDVIHTLAEILPLDGQSRESWVRDLERLKDKLQSAVHFILQTLGAACNYHHYYNKANSWYVAVLRENFLQELLSGIHGDSAQENRKSWGTIPAWRRNLSAFLKKNPPPDMEELLNLAHLSSVIPDDEVQQAGKEISQRCMTLRKLLISSGPVAVANLQMALQWQYDLLRSSHLNRSSPDHATHTTIRDEQRTSSDGNTEAAHLLKPGMASAEGKPASLSSFDSGFDGAVVSQMESWSGRERVENLSRLPWPGDSVKPALNRPEIHIDENLSTVSDGEDHRKEFDLGSLGDSSRASFQVVPKVTADSLNFEIKVKRSAALPSNPWLSLPVDDLENSYTVTITPNPSPRKTTDPRGTASLSSQSPDQQAETPNRTDSRQSQDVEWSIHSQSDLEESDLSHISNVLSSTITDGRDQTSCTTEGMPTLLWDSYDLHHQNPDVVDGVMDDSLNDWDVKEQEGLSKVEKILSRADEILEEEENVLAQEAVLDALLRSEDRHNDWPRWEGQDGIGVMSSTELAEAGILGFEDCLDPSDSNSEIGSVESFSDSKDASDRYAYTTTEPNEPPSTCRPDLLAELKKVHLLDEMIAEENQKLQELRHREDEINDEQLEKQAPATPSEEREAFRLQLETEKREVEKLEKSLEKNLPAKEVLSCSVMEKIKTEEEEDRLLFDRLLSSRYSRAKGGSPVLQQSEDEDSQDTETLEALSNASEEAMQERHGPVDSEGGNQEEISEELDRSQESPTDLDRFSDATLQYSDQPSLSLCHSGDTIDLSVCEKASPLNSFESGESGEPDEENLQEIISEPFGPSSLSHDHPVNNRTNSDTNLKSSEDVLPQNLEKLIVNRSIYPPAASLTSKLTPDDAGECDPGEKPLLLPPVPKPRKGLLPVTNGLAQLEIPHSVKVLHPDQTQDPNVSEPESRDPLPENAPTCSQHTLTLNPNVNAHSNNNNNNLSVNSSLEVNSKNEAPDRQVSGSVNEHLENPPTPKLAPNQPLEFDPGGAEEWVRSSSLSYSESVRRSGSGSPGVQPVCNTREMGQFKTPIVLDTGSGLMKAGFAGQDLPSVLFPTIIGMPKYEEIMNGNLEREVYIGHDAQHMRGVLALKHPIKNGIIRNWDDMEKIWHHTFQQLGVEPDDHPVLLTEAAMNPVENRQRTVEVMFECFGVPLTYVAMQAVLALYAAGRSTGVVLESGDGVSHSVPVFEGYCLPHAIQRFPLAGVDVTLHLKKILQEQGVSMRTSAEEEIVREMKEKSCYVSLDYEAELSRGGASCREVYYTMPDGQIVTLTTERFRAPEILFRPELIGRDHHGIHESVFKSILGSDIDLRRSFLGNILLSGGNTLLPGLPERLQAELRSLASGEFSAAVRVSSPKERDFLVWRGGAVLVELPGFSSAWISQEEYEEYGPQIVSRKCF